MKVKDLGETPKEHQTIHILMALFITALSFIISLITLFSMNEWVLPLIMFFSTLLTIKYIDQKGDSKYEKEYFEKLQEIKDSLLNKIEIVNDNRKQSMREYEIIGKIETESNYDERISLVQLLEKAEERGANAIIDMDRIHDKKTIVSQSAITVDRKASFSINPFSRGEVIGVSGGDISVTEEIYYIYKATAVRYKLTKEEHEIKFTEDQAYEAINKANTLFENEMITKEERDSRIKEAKEKRQKYINFLETKQREF